MKCPKCGSTDIKKTPLRTILFLGFLMTSGFLTILGIFFFPLLFISFPLFVGSFLVFLFPMPNYKCVPCNQAYRKKKVTA